MRKPYDVSKHPPSALPSNGRLYAGDSMYYVDEIRLHYVDYTAHFIFALYEHVYTLI